MNRIHDETAGGGADASWAGSPAHGEDAALAARAARAGGRAAMAFYGREDLDVADPGRGPVTAADRASHDAILTTLRDARPDERVLSEEDAHAPPSGMATGRLWIVDPLDGTREFIDEIPEFSVMVGLAIDGEARLGAVYQPVQDRLYVGVVGEGAWRADGGSDPVRLDAAGPAREPLRLVRSRSHPDARLAELESALDPVEIILSGSAGTKCALVAEGSADLYVHPVPYLKEWDTCAPEAVLRGAGGGVTDCVGGALRYGKADPGQPRGLFAARPGARDRVAEVVHRIGVALVD